ncbi:MAG: succinate dehydrogenase [Gammaproteobacteria bacterium]|nr:succinate dehydrogenase [Gammaproteobacteria bacterium]MDH3537891.1 succinate dehydrogenase [Gammaproteobacteria bacterium]
MVELRLYLAQRISAAIMAPLVLLHIGVMIYAIQGGLSADEILGRTRGSLLWGGVYGIFVLAVAVHAAIGLRNILREWWSLRGLLLNTLSWVCAAGLLVMGLRAVAAVVGSA